MRALPELRGRVRWADGTPVGRYLVMVGPGEEPSGYECEQADVDNPEGHFSIRPDQFPKEGNLFWIGVKAEGAAPWEGVVPLADLRSGDFLITLAEGFSLSGTLQLPASAKGSLRVKLGEVPGKRQDDDAIFVSGDRKPLLPGFEGDIPPGAPLRIPDLRPGEYQLRLRGEGVTPLLLTVTLGERDLDLGEVRLLGTGTISGKVSDPYKRKKPWRFADGEIHVEGFGGGPWDSYRDFKTDAEGRFRVEGVPCGTIGVSFAYHMTADIIGSVNAEVQVEEGKETEVRFEQRE